MDKLAGQPIRYLIVTLFAVAFGVEEAIIVLYLRRLPSQPGWVHVAGAAAPAISPDTYHLELGREVCTVVVLAVVAALAGTRLDRRFRYFLFAFGAWDIIYYVGLWVLSGYPDFTSSDVLFLIPVPWIGPVWAVIAFAAAFMLLGFYGIARRRVLVFVAGLLLGWLSFVYASLAGLAPNQYPIWLFVPAMALVMVSLPVGEKQH